MCGGSGLLCLGGVPAWRRLPMLPRTRATLIKRDEGTAYCCDLLVFTHRVSDNRRCVLSGEMCCAV